MTHSILIIDDSKDMHRLIRAAFAEEPWRVESAYSGSEGLKMASDDPPDLVLLDIDLPDMNGFDVCRHLKADRFACRASVIFISTSNGADEKVCGLKLKAVDYVTKPFEPAELRVRVETALQVKSMLDTIPIWLTHGQSIKESSNVNDCR
jgi:DNA-binding response OmpR family regulator